MPPRTLASLAHALAAASDLDVALVALGEAVAEVDRSSRVALISFDERRQMLAERRSPNGSRVERRRVDTTFDHLPVRLRVPVSAGGQFVDVGDDSDDYARLFGIASLNEEGLLAVRGITTEGHLSAVMALLEPRRFFGTRVMERFAPFVALFELAYARFSEREAREEAVHTLEDVTQRVHGEYVKRLAELERELAAARNTPSSVAAALSPERLVALETDAANAREEARRATRRADAVEGQVTAAVGQLEQAHIELHRRSETLRQKTRTLYLIDRVLTLDAATADPRQLADGLLALVGDDMQAQRCSLILRIPGSDEMYIAASKGLSPDIGEGQRLRIGVGVAGKVAASREPLLVTDVAEARGHPLLGDEYFTTGSFISFPLAYHDELVGVLNLTNRAKRGVYVDDDVERVRLLALVISLVTVHAALPERLLVTIGAH